MTRVQVTSSRHKIRLRFSLEAKRALAGVGWDAILQYEVFCEHLSTRESGRLITLQTHHVTVVRPCFSTGAILSTDAADAALRLELHSRPPDCALAQSLPSLAHRDLHGRQDDPDRIPGVLGIPVDGASQPVAIF